jgi:Putative metallopeptidase
MSMRRIRALLWIVGTLLAPGCVAPALAQSSQLSDRVVLVVEDNDGGYRATKNKSYTAVRDRIIKARLLERLRDFLSPVRLPRSIGLLATECDGGDGASPFYHSGYRTITVCYQFIALAETMVDRVMAAVTKDPKRYPFPITRDEFLWGLIGGVLLHESGHALFDVLDVPVFGREEDAADQISILVALHLRPQLAEAAVKSYAYFWRLVPDPDSGMTKDGKLNEDFADEHGTASQRLFNGLCIGYGHSPAVFGKFVSAGWLPEARAKGCAREHARIESAFIRTVMPFIDTKRMAEVQGVDWLAANYGPAQPATAVVRNTPPATSARSDAPPGGQGPVGWGTVQ